MVMDPLQRRVLLLHLWFWCRELICSCVCVRACCDDYVYGYSQWALLLCFAATIVFVAAILAALINSFIVSDCGHYHRVSMCPSNYISLIMVGVGPYVCVTVWSVGSFVFHVLQSKRVHAWTNNQLTLRIGRGSRRGVQRKQRRNQQPWTENGNGNQNCAGMPKLSRTSHKTTRYSDRLHYMRAETFFDLTTYMHKWRRRRPARPETTSRRPPRKFLVVGYPWWRRWRSVG